MNEYWLLIDKITPESRTTLELRNVLEKQVCLSTVKRATCNDFVPKTRTILYLLQQPDLLQDGFERG